MITIRAEEGTATYSLDPYPRWTGSEAMSDRGEALRAQVDTAMVAQGLDTSSDTRSQQLQKAFETACLLDGITVLHSTIPPLDPPYDPSIVR